MQDGTSDVRPAPTRGRRVEPGRIGAATRIPPATGAARLALVSIASGATRAAAQDAWRDRGGVDHDDVAPVAPRGLGRRDVRS
jgi:hypothetical protein